MLCFSLATLENIIRIIRRTIFPSYIECKCSMYICQVMVFSSIPPPMKAVLREHVSSFDFLSENQKKSEKPTSMVVLIREPLGHLSEN